MYGFPPPIHIPYFPRDFKMAVVDQFLQDREFALQLMKYHLSKAQHRMKHYADQHRTDRSFSIGDCVYLKLQLYRQLSVS